MKELLEPFWLIIVGIGSIISYIWNMPAAEFLVGLTDIGIVIVKLTFGLGAIWVVLGVLSLIWAKVKGIKRPPK